MWILPITDRTQADVNYAQAHRDSPEPLKGARNHTDLQRITGNIHYLAALIREHGYIISVTCKTSWALGEIPPAAEIEKIRNDLNTLKSTIGAIKVQTPGLPYTHFEKMNDVEKIVLEMNDTLSRMASSFIHSGMNYSGLEGIRS